MGLFDGMASALAGVFGDDAIITRKSGSASTVSGAVLRHVVVDEDIADGRATPVEVPVLRLPKSVAVLERGDTVALLADPAAVFVVLDFAASASSAADAFITYRLEPR